MTLLSREDKAMLDRHDASIRLLDMRRDLNGLVLRGASNEEIKQGICDIDQALIHFAVTHIKFSEDDTWMHDCLLARDNGDFQEPIEILYDAVAKEFWAPDPEDKAKPLQVQKDNGQIVPARFSVFYTTYTYARETLKNRQIGMPENCRPVFYG